MVNKSDMTMSKVVFVSRLRVWIAQSQSGMYPGLFVNLVTVVKQGPQVSHVGWLFDVVEGHRVWRTARHPKF